MRDSLPSTVEECLEYMGKPQISIDIKDKPEAEVRTLKLAFRVIASRRGYDNLVWKRDKNNLYAF